MNQTVGFSPYKSCLPKGEQVLIVSKSPSSFGKSSQTATFPFTVLAVAIFLTVGITYSFYQSAKNKDAIRFNSEVNRVNLAIENKINLYVALLKGGRGFFESDNEITRADFAEYVRSLELQENYAGVQGIGYAKKVEASEIEALTKKMNAEHFADFKFSPVVGKKSYEIVTYLEPSSERNQKAVGFDLGGEPRRREALEKARDSGEASSSAKINLRPESPDGEDAGFLIVLPIYKNGRLPATLEDREKNIAGYIYCPFRASEFLYEIHTDKFASDIALRIYDEQPDAENLLAQFGDTENSSLAGQMEEHYSARNELSVAGRKWIIRYDSLPAFTAQSSLGWTPLIFLAGISGSFLLFGLTFWETASRLKLQKIAAELSESEKQKQGLFENEQKARLLAEQANSTKDEFIAVVSHELRTPLNAIAGWTRILKTDDLTTNTKNLALEKIEKNLRSQTRLVEQLLDYSQIVAGTITLNGKNLNFSNVFEDIFSEIEPSAREKSIEFLKNNQLNDGLVLGDEEKIKLAIHNILTNAIKFTHSGGRIETSVLEINGTINFTVKDNGIGISPEFLPRVFDQFAQADSSTTRSSGGLGLGLTISHHIIQLHHGTIEAFSEGVGKGSIFTVKVPLTH